MKTLFCSLIATTALITQLSHAESTQTYQCSHNNATRTISIEYPNAAAVPCHVSYTKEGETESTTLWSAQNEAGYCEEKGLAFIEKQRAWGWECNQVGAETVAETEATAD